MKSNMKKLKEKIKELQKSRRSFAEFLEEKMDEFDYSNTTLAKKVFHRVEDKDTRESRFVPVTRQAIAAWLKGTMPGSREIYVSLGMAFDMSLREINKELLEVYMGTGLYCKNIDDAIWIAVIHRLFSFEELNEVQKEIEEMVYGDGIDGIESEKRVLTTDLWRDLEAASTKEDFFAVICENREEFQDGARKFGKCLDEVIEEEYGCFEKNTDFLADIGCLHCEAQFSKIRAGKAIVTREWLLRFLLSMQPSYESIEKLLAKAQMEPLGITPVELVIETIAREKGSNFATSQEVWIAIEELCEALMDEGISMDDVLSRKYDSVYTLPWNQKVFFLALVGKKMMECRQQKDYGYDNRDYCRHQLTDRILFEEMNRLKKNAGLKSFAAHIREKEKKEIEKVLTDSVMEILLPDRLCKDEYHRERFTEYCYQEEADKKSAAYPANDIYFYTALLYSAFTGRCYTKDFDEGKETVVRAFVTEPAAADVLVSIFYQNLGAGLNCSHMIPLKEIVLKLLSLM